MQSNAIRLSTLSRHHPQGASHNASCSWGATIDTAGALRVWMQSREIIQPPNGLNFYSQFNDNLLAQAAKNLLLVALKMLKVRHLFRSVNPSCFR
jgi:hypothetical protein